MQEARRCRRQAEGKRSSRGGHAGLVPDALAHAQELRRQRVEQLPPLFAGCDGLIDPARRRWFHACHDPPSIATLGGQLQRCGP